MSHWAGQPIPRCRLQAEEALVELKSSKELEAAQQAAAAAAAKVARMTARLQKVSHCLSPSEPSD